MLQEGCQRNIAHAVRHQGDFSITDPVGETGFIAVEGVQEIRDAIGAPDGVIIGSNRDIGPGKPAHNDESGFAVSLDSGYAVGIEQVVKIPAPAMQEENDILILVPGKNPVEKHIGGGEAGGTIHPFFRRIELYSAVVELSEVPAA